MKPQLKITCYGPNRYVVEFENRSRVYMINHHALKWNLKHIFGFSASEVVAVMVMLEVKPSVSVDLKEAS